MIFAMGPESVAIKAQKDGVLVLGASGKLGRMALRVWQSMAGQHPGIIPVFRRGSTTGAGVIWQPGHAVPQLDGIQTIVAFWGVTPGPGRILQDNAHLAVAAMELAKALGADRVLHCSSGAVYGNRASPLRESSPCAPAHPYGIAKLQREQAVRQWQDQTPRAPRACFLRIGNVAGAESLFAALKRDGPVTLDRFSDGLGPQRSYIGPEDLARACQALLQSGLDCLPDVVNIAAPRPTAMASLARAAGKQVVWRPAPTTAIQTVHLDTTRLDQILPLDDTAAAADTLVSQWRKWRDTP